MQKSGTTYGKRYYQITAIDEFSRKRILEICDEKSSYETGKFLEKLEEKMGFPIKIIQVDNGYEFVNDREKTNKKGYFENWKVQQLNDRIFSSIKSNWQDEFFNISKIEKIFFIMTYP